MKKKHLKSLKLNKHSISQFENKLIGGLDMSTPQGCVGSQHDSKCGFSCQNDLCPNDQ